MLELICGFVRVFADTFAEDDTALVEENVALHRFQSELTQSVAFALGPDAESSLKKQTSQFG